MSKLSRKKEREEKVWSQDKKSKMRDNIVVITYYFDSDHLQVPRSELLSLFLLLINCKQTKSISESAQRLSCSIVEDYSTPALLRVDGSSPSVWPSLALGGSCLRLTRAWLQRRFFSGLLGGCPILHFDQPCLQTRHALIIITLNLNLHLKPWQLATSLR